jgi:hypothetical protein
MAPWFSAQAMNNPFDKSQLPMSKLGISMTWMRWRLSSLTTPNGSTLSGCGGVGSRRSSWGHQWIHEKLFQNTAIHIDSCSVRFLTRETAATVVTWSKGSFFTPDGKQVPEGKDRMSLFW